MISRTLAVVLALGAALLQASRGAWVEATGLIALAIGLLILRVWPSQKRWATVAFAVTVVTLVVVFVRRVQTGF